MSIRIYIRTKKKYEPKYFDSPLWHFDVTDFAGCTVGNIKEEFRKCTGSKAEDLFYLNQPLADDRSVAHYNLPDGVILETTSNPLWVAMMHVKMIEIQRARDAQPLNPAVQRWTHKSFVRKVTLLSVLFNARKLENVQPPHFPTLDDFVVYLERLGRKGAAINPGYSGKDFRDWFNEYLNLDTASPDPIRAFQSRHAARLGLIGAEDDDNKSGGASGKAARKPKGKGRQAVKRVMSAAGARGQQKQDRLCEDCEQSVADVYCGSCVGAGGRTGVALCLACTDQIHRGALRGGHDCKPISEAPKAAQNSQEYCPHPYKAPFAILLAMTRALEEQKLSLDEEEIKQRAQPLTDTDLQDKQAGKVMGGFDCIENTLIPKSLVQKEASGRHTFALTNKGRELGRRLDVFDQTLQRFLTDSGVPSLPAKLQCIVGNRRLVLVVDQRERDLRRLRSLASEAGIPVIVRNLLVADYIWVLAPESDGVTDVYDGTQQEKETMLPILVERKSWNDLHDSMRLGRWNAQIQRMKACGFGLNFVLIEGSVNDLRQVSQDRKGELQAELDRLCVEDGFQVGRTWCWSKSRLWLFWLTHWLAQACSQGHFAHETLQFSELSGRVGRGQRQMRGGEAVRAPPPPGPCHVWESERLVTAIFRDSLGEKGMAQTCDDFFNLAGQDVRQLLLIQNVETYNKSRHAILYSCLRGILATDNCSKETVTGFVENQLVGSLKELVHFDVLNFWLLFMQVNAYACVMTTEEEEDTQRLGDWFTSGGDWVRRDEPSPTVLQGRTHRKASPTSTVTSQQASDVVERETKKKSLAEDDFASDSQLEERMLQEALSLSLIDSMNHGDRGDADVLIPAGDNRRCYTDSAHPSPTRRHPLHDQFSVHSASISGSTQNATQSVVPPSLSLRSWPPPLGGRTDSSSAVERLPVTSPSLTNTTSVASVYTGLGTDSVIPSSVIFDLGEWYSGDEVDSLSCTSKSLYQGGHNVSAKSEKNQFTEGSEMDDAILIDSQGDDAGEVAILIDSQGDDFGECSASSVLDEDAALAKRLQEEENMKVTAVDDSLDVQGVSWDGHTSQAKLHQDGNKHSTADKTSVEVKREPEMLECLSEFPDTFNSQTVSELQHRTKRQTEDHEPCWQSGGSPRKKCRTQVESDEELAQRLERELNGGFVTEVFPQSSPPRSGLSLNTIGMEGVNMIGMEGVNMIGMEGVNMIGMEGVNRIGMEGEAQSVEESDETLALKLQQEELEAAGSCSLPDHFSVDLNTSVNKHLKSNVQIKSHLDVHPPVKSYSDSPLKETFPQSVLNSQTSDTASISSLNCTQTTILSTQASVVDRAIKNRSLSKPYIDEDEELARRLQQQEEMGAGGVHFEWSEVARCRSPVKDVKPVGLTGKLDFTLSEVRKTELGEDNEETDGELARKLQEEETKQSLANSLEDYRSWQKEKYYSQRDRVKHCETSPTPTKSPFPPSLLSSTPKTQAKKVPKSDAVSPVSGHRDVKVLSRVKQEDFLAESNDSAIRDKLGRNLAADKRFHGNEGESKFSPKGNKNVVSPPFTSKREVTATATSTDPVRDLGPSFNEFVDLSFSDRFRKDKPATKATTDSSLLRTASLKVDTSSLEDSIDLTGDEEALYIGSSSRPTQLLSNCTNSKLQSPQCPKDQSVLFPTFPLPKQQRQEGGGGTQEGGGGTQDRSAADALTKRDADGDQDFKFGEGAAPDVLECVKQIRQDDKKLTVLNTEGVASHQSSSSTLPPVSPVASNVRCGSCGQKGHNRRFDRCPNYFTQQEKERRDAMEVAQRRRVEERAREAEERQREERRALERLAATREALQRNKEEMMQQIATATQQCASQFQSQLDDIDKLMTSKERKIKGREANHRRK